MLQLLHSHLPTVTSEDTTTDYSFH